MKSKSADLSWDREADDIALPTRSSYSSSSFIGGTRSRSARELGRELFTPLLRDLPMSIRASMPLQRSGTLLDYIEETRVHHAGTLHRNRVNTMAGANVVIQSDMQLCCMCKRRQSLDNSKFSVCQQCYDDSVKNCKRCGDDIELGFLHLRSELCSPCWDTYRDAADSPGQYFIAFTGLEVFSGPKDDGTSTSTKGKICRGDIIDVVEVMKIDEVSRGVSRSRVRGRIKQPMPGWISLLNLDDGFRKAVATSMATIELRFTTTSAKSAKVDGDKFIDALKSRLVEKSMTERNVNRFDMKVRQHAGQLYVEICGLAIEELRKKVLDCLEAEPIAIDGWDLREEVKEKKQAKISYGKRQSGKMMASIEPGVRAVIAGQFIFYMAPASMAPGLYYELQTLSTQDATSMYAAVLTTASVVSMLAPMPLGLWAERRGEKEVYVGTTLVAAVAAMVLSFTKTPVIFFAAWGLVMAPPSLRGVRAVYFAMHVKPKKLKDVSQLATASGLAGGLVGPVVASLAERVCGSAQDSSRWPDGFQAGAMFAAVIHLVSAVILCTSLKTRRIRRPGEYVRQASNLADEKRTCDKCSTVLTADDDELFDLYLCADHHERFAKGWSCTKPDPQWSFEKYRNFVLCTFCLIASFLEVSMNGGVVACFQPIVIQHFEWSLDTISVIQFVGALLAIILSFGVVKMKLNPMLQTNIAAGLYLGGVLLFVMPPLSEWRAVVGLMAGLKAQILFSSPFTSIFTEKIGRNRMTNRLSIILTLSTSVGTMVGTAMGPIFVPLAGQLSFLLITLPALGAVWLLIFVFSILRNG